MTLNLPCNTGWVEVPNADLRISAYLAEPVQTGPYPAVIVIQEVFGVNAHIREVTERIASWGYVVIAPAIYQRTAPGFDVGYGPEELARGRQYKDLTTAEELESDIQATITYLQTLAKVQKNCTGCIGFCFGGHVAYLAALNPAIAATAVCYGSGIAVFTPGGGAPTVTRTGEIHGTLHGFFGTEDPLIPNTQVDQIEAALRQQGVPHQIFRYPCGHGFCCDRRADYDPTAATDVWKRVESLYIQVLKGGQVRE